MHYWRIVTAQHRKQEAAFGHYRFMVVRVVLTSRSDEAGCFIVVVPAGVYKHNGAVGVKDAALFVEFPVVDPVVVAGAISYIVAGSCEDAIEIVVEQPFVGVVQHEFDFLWIFCRVLLAYTGGVIGRAVLSDYDFIIEVSFLSQDRVKSAGYGVLLIVGGDDDRYFGSVKVHLEGVEFVIKREYPRLYCTKTIYER